MMLIILWWVIVWYGTILLIYRFTIIYRESKHFAMYLGTHHMMGLVPTKSSCCTYIIRVHRLYDFIPNDTSNMLYAAMEM